MTEDQSRFFNKPRNGVSLGPKLLRKNTRAAKKTFGRSFPPRLIAHLKTLTRDLGFSIEAGELQIIGANWYVTHTGLLRLARRKRCCGIHVEAVDSLCDSAVNRFVLKATVYPSKDSAGFVGYGDADPSNVSALVRGAEMRIAETRAVNRALRKAYGIGICSVEEIGSNPGSIVAPDSHKSPPKGTNENGNGAGHKVRDRLCQIIRQHKLDPELVKAFAVDFCGTKALKDASQNHRDQPQAGVTTFQQLYPCTVVHTIGPCVLCLSLDEALPKS